MRIAVLVLATDRPPYPDLIRTQKRTWAARDVDGVDVAFYYGGATADVRQGRDLRLAVPDGYWDAGRKTLACFEHLLAADGFDVVFRTNCSSYVDLPNLQRWSLEHVRPVGFYAGAVLDVSAEQAVRVRRRDGGNGGTAPTSGWTFASGAGYFLSRDLVEAVVSAAPRWDHAYVDDMALGKLLAEDGVAPEEAPRQVLRNPWRPRRIDTSQFLFRCKTDSSERRGDVDLMLRVDHAFATVRGEAVRPWYTPVRAAKIALREATGRRGR